MFNRSIVYLTQPWTVEHLNLLFFFPFFSFSFFGLRKIKTILNEGCHVERKSSPFTLLLLLLSFSWVFTDLLIHLPWSWTKSPIKTVILIANEQLSFLTQSRQKICKGPQILYLYQLSHVECTIAHASENDSQCCFQ